MANSNQECFTLKTFPLNFRGNYFSHNITVVSKKNVFFFKCIAHATQRKLLKIGRYRTFFPLKIITTLRLSDIRGNNEVGAKLIGSSDSFFIMESTANWY